MLTKTFWKLAKKEVVNWEDVFNVWGKGYNLDRPVLTFKNTVSHCGTVELVDAHSSDRNQGATLERLAAAICYSVHECELGHFVYYCPKAALYRGGTERLRKLGFKKVGEFVHFGFTDRRPDYGHSEMWELSVTKAEAAAIRKLARDYENEQDESVDVSDEF